MSKKQLIYLVILLLSFGTGGYLLYRSFVPAANNLSDVGQVSSERILPMGSSLDFTPIEKFNKEKRVYSYPQVTPPEIGQGLSEMVQQ